MGTFLLRVGILLSLISIGTWKLNPQLFNQLIQQATSQMAIAKTSEPNVKVQAVTLETMQKLSHLTTDSRTLQIIVPVEQTASFGGFEIGKTKVLYIAKTNVKAGINLDKLTQKNIKIEETGKTTIVLPAPEILDTKLDVEASKVYDTSKTSFLAPDTAAKLTEEAQRNAIKEAKKEACNSDLLNEAAISAEQKLTAFFELTNSNINVEVEKPSACTI